MKLIPLTKGQFAVVDDWNYDWLSGFHWQAMYCSKAKTFYAYRRKSGGGNIAMHRQILNVEDGKDVDHIHHNGLDNRESELRICSRRTNILNGRYNPGVSGYRGVTKKRSKWRAYLNFNFKQINVGIFDTPEQAALARDEAVRNQYDLHDQFFNFPRIGEKPVPKP